MQWNDKIELCTLLNNGNYAEAVEFIRNKDIDPQAMDMFITGFDLNAIDVENTNIEKVMDKVEIIHTGKGLIPQEQFSKKFEYIPCLLEQPYMELMAFSEFKKIWSRGREEPKPTKPTLIFKECEFKKFAHLIDNAIKRDYEITSENGEVKFTPKKK